MSNFYGTLTTTTPPYTVTSGFNTTLYDARGSQQINVQQGASLSLLGASGNNLITLHGNSSEWLVMRDGSTAIFTHTSGNRVEIPAILDAQTIAFNNNAASLRIDTSAGSASVKLGEQVLTTAESAVEAWADEGGGEEPGAGDYEGSTELAPWMLVMPHVWHGIGNLISDGTASGTYEAAYFQVGKVDPENQVIWGIQSSSPYGTELYRTVVGSTGITSNLVKDIYPGVNSGSPQSLVLLPNGNLIFAASDGINGRQPWVSDGTEAGTSILRNLNPNNNWWGSFPSQFSSFGDSVAFVAEAAYLSDSANYVGAELFFTDGTAEGTTWLDIYPGSFNSSWPSIIGTIGNLLYFSATDADGQAIFSTDGATFTRLASINESATLLGWSGTQAFFKLSDSTHGEELWVTDLSTGSFSLVKDILPGSGAALAETSSATMAAGKLTFTAYTSATTKAFFVSDGTTAGTLQISNSAPIDQVTVGSTLVFADSEGLKTVDLSAASPSTTIVSSASLMMWKDALQPDGDQVFYLTNDGVLHAGNSTLTATITLANNVAKFKVLADDAIYFIAEHNGTSSLWFSNGTPAGTRFVENLPYSADGYNLDGAVALRTPGTPGPQDTASPMLRSATVEGDQLVLTFTDSNALDANNPPPTNAFSLSGTSASIVSVGINAQAKTVTLKLDTTVRSDDVVKISYTDPSAANDAAALQDSAGNDVASFNNRAVINKTADNVAPTVVGATVNGALLTLQLVDTNALNATNLPDASSFALSGTAVTVSSVSVDANGKTVSLTLSEAVKAGEAVTLAYTDSTDGNDVAALQDVAGNDVASFAGQVVQNLTQEKAAWTLLMAATEYWNSFLYASDSTEAGSGLVLVGDPNAYYPPKLTVNQNQTKALFVRSTNSYSSKDVYGTDGTLSGTLLLGSGVSSYDSYASVVAGNLFAFSGPNGLITDGTQAGTVTAFNLESVAIDPIGSMVWSSQATPPYGRELYRTEIGATGAVTTLVKDIYSGASSGDPTNLLVLPNGKLVFSANDGVHGREPWVSDGTEAGTFMLSDLNDVHSEGSYPEQMTVLSEKVAFVATSWNPNGAGDYVGRELFFTDGTTEGTTLMDIHPSSDSFPLVLGVVGDLLYFTATDANGQAIFSTDGATFTRLAPINSSASLLGWSDVQAFFKLSDSTHGEELWVADLSGGSFSLVKDILPGTGAALAGANAAEMVGGKLIFTAYHSGTTQGFFVSDGTEAGTVQIGNSTPTDKVTLGSTLVFADSTGLKAADLSADVPSAVSLSSVSLKLGTDALQADSDQAFYLTRDGVLHVSTAELLDGVELASNVAKFKAVAEDHVYFITEDNGIASLWFSDGTVTGTRYVEDLPYEASIFDMDNAVVVMTVGV